MLVARRELASGAELLLSVLERCLLSRWKTARRRASMLHEIPMLSAVGVARWNQRTTIGCTAGDEHGLDALLPEGGHAGDGEGRRRSGTDLDLRVEKWGAQVGLSRPVPHSERSGHSRAMASMG